MALLFSAVVLGIGSPTFGGGGTAACFILLEECDCEYGKGSGRLPGCGAGGCCDTADTVVADMFESGMILVGGGWYVVVAVPPPAAAAKAPVGAGPDAFAPGRASAYGD